MSSNKSAKNALIEIYGKHCMFERARIAERIEAMGGIRTYKSYVAEKRFKGKKIAKQLTYHHLVHKSDSGKATVENGALVDATAHAYLHSLPRRQEEIINNMLRAYKINAMAFTTEEVLDHASVEFDTELTAEDLMEVVEIYKGEDLSKKSNKRKKNTRTT